MIPLQRLNELERKFRNLNIRGLVEKADPTMGPGGCVRVAYGDNQLSDWLPVKPIRSGVASIWWFPEVGEGVSVDDIETGEVSPGSFTSVLPPPTRDPNVFHIQFKNGDRVSHNSETGVMEIIPKTELNIITETANITATNINSVGDWLHTGPMKVTKTLEVVKELTVLSTSTLTKNVSMPGGFVSGGLAMSGGETGTMAGTIDVTGEITINGIKLGIHKHNDAEGREVGLPI